MLSFDEVTLTESSSPSESLYPRGIDKSSSSLKSCAPIVDKIGASLTGLTVIKIVACSEAPLVLLEFSTVNVIESVPE